MRIALDAMGGDNAPIVNVEGALEALKIDSRLEIVLVGDERILNPLIKKYAAPIDRLFIHHASEVITMHDAATQGVRKKKDASINVMYNLQKEHKAVASVSAGHTGAMLTAGLFCLGRLSGVKRAAIATFLPTEKGRCILLDAGANMDCKAEYLAQFATMGSIYCKHMLGVDSPRVGLLNVGEETTKGNEAARQAHEILTTLPLNFIGNIEGSDIFKGTADVIVCDGFIGNIVLKFAEGIIGFIRSTLKHHTSKSLLAKGGLVLLAPSLTALTRRMDYSEYGGAPLLGLDGVGIVSHGKSNAKAIKNALLVAAKFVENRVNDLIREQLSVGVQPASPTAEE